jgi:hypothetical protein
MPYQFAEFTRHCVRNAASRGALILVRAGACEEVLERQSIAFIRSASLNWHGERARSCGAAAIVCLLKWATDQRERNR